MVSDRNGRGTMTDEEKGFFKKLGLRIGERRRLQAFTQTQLAQQLGVSYQTVNSFEHGRRRVPVSLLPALARALDTSIEELVGDDSNKLPRKKRGPSSRLHQQIEEIRQLPRTKQKFVIQMLDVVLAQAKKKSAA